MFNKLEPQDLKNFHPFHLVDDDQLWMLACSVEIKTVDIGDVLFQVGDEDDSEYYLLEGEVELRASDGVVKSVKSGELVAKHPIARLRPRRYTAVSKQPSIFFCVHRDVLAALHAGGIDLQTNTNSYVVNEIPIVGSAHNDFDSEVHQTIIAAVVHDLKINAFILPNYSAISSRIVDEIYNDDASSVSNVARISCMDSVNVAKLFKAANSSIYRDVESCTALNDAIARLGVNTTKQLVHCFVTRDEFLSSRDEYLNTILRDAWRASQRVSVIVATLSKILPGFDEQTGALAGLLHNIGTLGLIPYLEKYSAYFNSTAEVDEVIKVLSSRVGAVILQHYGLPDTMVTVAAGCHDWLREETTKIDYCDLVTFACLQNAIGRPHLSKLPKFQSVAAFRKLTQMKVTPEVMIKVMALVNKKTDWINRTPMAEAI